MKENKTKLWTLIRFGSFLLGLGVILVVINPLYEDENTRWMLFGVIRVFYAGIFCILTGNVLIIIGVVKKFKKRIKNK